MFKIKIICIGKFKEDYWRSAEAEYLKRLQPYAKVEVVELRDRAFKNANEREIIIDQEGDEILKKIPADSLVVAMEIEAKEKTSEQMAEWLSQEGEGGREVCLIIGGPLGLSSAVKSKAKQHFSLSRLTLPHQLARILLVEQIYRSITILNGKQYHY